MSAISGNSAQTISSVARTFTTPSGKTNALEEVGQQTVTVNGVDYPDVTLVQAVGETAVYTAMRDIIHAAGSANPFKAGNPNLPASATENLLTGCKVYKRHNTDSGAIEYWRTFLFQKESHGIAVDTGSTVDNLLNKATASNYAVSFSAGNALFLEPLRIIAKPTEETCRVNLGQSRGAFNSLVVGASTLIGGQLHGLVDVVSDSAITAPPLGGEIVAPSAVTGALLNASFPTAMMYYVLDEDHIVIYTNKQFKNSGALTTLTDETSRTFLCLGNLNGDITQADQFASAVSMNPRSLAITTTYADQIIPTDVRMIEFFATGGDTTIQLGFYKSLFTSGGAHGPAFLVTSPIVVVPQNTRVKVPVNTSDICAFNAKTSNGAGDTLYWNYIVG